MRLSEDVLERTHAALLKPSGDELVQFMARVGLAQDVSAAPDWLFELTQEFGWMDQNRSATPIGFCASDSFREYKFWKERDRKLPFYSDAEFLQLDAFVDKSVLEIGCGMGINLMSMQSVTKNVVGVDPIEVYGQMGRVFSDIENVAAPEIRVGGAENMPVDDSSYDLAFCTGAHQFFEMGPAFSEIARVLKPGGEFFAIGWDLSYFLKAYRPTRVHTISLINTLGYSILGKRVIPPKPHTSTSRPIYPSVKALAHWISASNLDPLDPVPVEGELCLRARKPLN